MNTAAFASLSQVEFAIKLKVLHIIFKLEHIVRGFIILYYRIYNLKSFSVVGPFKRAIYCFANMLRYINNDCDDDHLEYDYGDYDIPEYDDGDYNILGNDDCDDHHLDYDNSDDDIFGFDDCDDLHLESDDCDDDHLDIQSRTDCGTILGAASPSQTLLVPPTLVRKY